MPELPPDREVNIKITIIKKTNPERAYPIVKYSDSFDFVSSVSGVSSPESETKSDLTFCKFVPHSGQNLLVLPTRTSQTGQLLIFFKA